MINYYLITKPGIILGNLITVGAGFLLASQGNINYLLFFQTVIGITLVIASACVFNNFIDINLDKKMSRTNNRPLVIGLIPVEKALVFGTILGICGGATLLAFTNVLTFLIAVMGFCIYVFLYSIWKSQTIYATAIGSMAGALPPVIGYCAVSNRVDLGAILLFLIMVFWQMPHFYAIALYHYDDYRTAKIPLLPIVKGSERAKVHMTLYIFGFIIVSLALYVSGYAGYIYFLTTSVVGLLWLALSLYGFNCQNDKIWGKHMFRWSLVVICAISLCMAI